jgi:hypothetical protein
MSCKDAGARMYSAVAGATECKVRAGLPRTVCAPGPGRAIGPPDARRGAVEPPAASPGPSQLRRRRAPRQPHTPPRRHARLQECTNSRSANREATACDGAGSGPSAALLKGTVSVAVTDTACS